MGSTTPGVTAYSTHGFLRCQNRPVPEGAVERPQALAGNMQVSEAKPAVSANAASLGSVAPSPALFLAPTFCMWGGRPQSSNLESGEPPRARAPPQEEALHLPQEKTSNLKHNFSIKYLTSLKVINIYHIPYSVTTEQQQGRGGERTVCLQPRDAGFGFHVAAEPSTGSRQGCSDLCSRCATFQGGNG